MLGYLLSLANRVIREMPVFMRSVERRITDLDKKLINKQKNGLKQDEVF